MKQLLLFGLAAAAFLSAPFPEQCIAIRKPSELKDKTTQTASAPGLTCADFTIETVAAAEQPKPDTKPQAAKEPPTEWIEPDTGHRVVRLSKEPGSSNLYFHQNAYSADGQKLIITTPGGLATVDLKTRAVDKIVESRNAIVTGRKTGQVYYNFSGNLAQLRAPDPATLQAWIGMAVSSRRASISPCPSWT